jgi:3-oxoacyl-[acyl-carrier protein] reductase
MMARMDLGLTDHVYVVTGGARGLGRAAAEALVADGARVVLSGRSVDSLSNAVEALGDNAIAVVADNADPATPGRLIDEAHEVWGRLDGVLISVGGPPLGKASEVSDADWSGAFESVFLGAVRLAREAAAALVEGGSITFVLSTSVKAPLSGLGISNGLRPGLAMVAKELADELGPRGIRVNCLLPGHVETERLLQLDAAAADPAAARAAAEASMPLRRYGRPEEFGRVAAFVMSGAASWITGSVIPVDGGLTRSL